MLIFWLAVHIEVGLRQTRAPGTSREGWSTSLHATTDHRFILSGRKGPDLWKCPCFDQIYSSAASRISYTDILKATRTHWQRQFSCSETGKKPPMNSLCTVEVFICRPRRFRTCQQCCCDKWGKRQLMLRWDHVGCRMRKDKRNKKKKKRVLCS